MSFCICFGFILGNIINFKDNIFKRIMEAESGLLKIFLISMLPIAELRGAIPYAIASGISPIKAYVAAISGNFFPVPLILFSLAFFEENVIRRSKILSSLFERITERTRIRARGRVEKYGAPALISFVAIPLPMTGAWTGALVAYLFGIDKKHAMIYIFAGILIAGAIITLASLSSVDVFHAFAK